MNANGLSDDSMHGPRLGIVSLLVVGCALALSGCSSVDRAGSVPKQESNRRSVRNVTTQMLVRYSYARKGLDMWKEKSAIEATEYETLLESEFQLEEGGIHRIVGTFTTVPVKVVLETRPRRAAIVIDIEVKAEDTSETLAIEQNIELRSPLRDESGADQYYLDLASEFGHSGALVRKVREWIRRDEGERRSSVDISHVGILITREK